MIADAPSSTLSDRLIERMPARAAEAATMDTVPIGERPAYRTRRWLADRAAHALIEPLLVLQEDWDSYGSHPPSRSLLNLAEGFAAELIVGGYPTPTVVPAADGSLSFEWTAAGYEFAITLNPTQYGANATVYYFNGETGQEWELDEPEPDDRLSSAFAELRMRAR